jgi:hypothetical protein
MKLYIHEGPGHYVGSVVIVVSDNYETAYEIISKRLDDMGLNKENISIIEKEIINNEIVFSKSGDY